jgi:hypothetical protein
MHTTIFENKLPINLQFIAKHIRKKEISQEIEISFKNIYILFKETDVVRTKNSTTSFNIFIKEAQITINSTTSKMKNLKVILMNGCDGICDFDILDWEVVIMPSNKVFAYGSCLA